MNRIIIQLTDNQLVRLQQEAEETGNSRSAIIRTALSEYLLNHDPKQAEQIVELNTKEIK